MKRLLYVVVVAAVMLFGLTFTFLNSQPVEVQYYFDTRWKGPLSVLLFVTWVAGALVGYLLSLFSSLRVRRELSRARRELQQERVEPGQV